MREIILASASPRRKDILQQVGVRFEVIKSEKEELITKNVPADIVIELSKLKAKDVAGRITKDALVIGADTVVAFNKLILGKPKDSEDAYRMLEMIQGKTHEVYTGVCVISTHDKKALLSFAESTQVEVYPMNKKQIEAYIDTKEPFDKAGAYAIQGTFARYVKSITGEYNNVVGLPVSRLLNELYQEGIDI